MSAYASALPRSIESRHLSAIGHITEAIYVHSQTMFNNRVFCLDTERETGDALRGAGACRKKSANPASVHKCGGRLPPACFSDVTRCDVLRNARLLPLHMPVDINSVYYSLYVLVSEIMSEIRAI